MRVIKYASIALLGLLLTVFILSLGLWYNLEILFTTSNLEWAQKKFLKEAKIEWKSVNVDVDNTGFLEKKINIESKILCVEYKSSSVCFDSIDLSLDLSFKKLSSYHFSKFKVKIKNAKAYAKDFLSDEGEKTFSSVYENLELVKNYFFLALKKLPDDFLISGDDMEFFQEDLSYSIKSSLSKEEGILNIDKNSKSFINLAYSWSEKIKMSGSFKDGSFYSDFKATANFLNEKLNLNSNLKVKPSLDYEAFNFDFEAQIKQDSDEVLVLFDSIKTQNIPYVEKLKISNLSIHFKESGDSKYTAEQISFFLDSNKVINKKKLNRKVFDHNYTLKSEGQFFEKILLSDETGTMLKSNVVLNPIENSLLKAKGEFEFEFDKINTERNALNPKDLSLDVKVLSFKNLVEDLKNSKLAIPAPINQFDGVVDFKVQDTDISAKKVCFPFTGDARLKAPSKSDLDVSVDGDYCMPRSDQSQVFVVNTSKNAESSELNLEAVITKLHFALPNLDPIKGVPNFTTDSRIVVKNLDKEERKEEKEEKKTTAQKSSSKKEKEGESELKYNIVVKTKRSQRSPIKVRYKYFKPYLPLELHAKLTNESSSYVVSSDKDWVIDYLDRKIEVEKMKISQSKKRPDEIKLDVRFKYEASIYVIYIDVGGSVDDPYIKLSSSPFLSRSDIISVLLYNRTASELSQFENESVGNTEAAVADRAIGLFGIWAFASTPIETVSYDPSSGVYSAQVALPGGVKFSLGTNWESVQNLSLRKRLSKSWLIVTSFDPGGVEESVGNIFLRREWVY